jgi:hypothetical protein
VTIIVDNTGTRWVETPERKRRRPARALRFAGLKVGDQLKSTWFEGTASIGRSEHYWVVTDLWFDPVKGEKHEVAGQMVAIRHLDPRTGEPIFGKQAHTLRGLASQGFHYADVDFPALVRARNEGVRQGAVIGIGMGNVIRRRPKIPTATF